MYGQGIDVPQDHTEAVKWYRLAAEQGHASAQLNLGAKYFYGEGVIQDYTEAVKWYRLAAEQGDVSAQVNLAYMYASGLAVIQDNVYAHMWWNIAASQGDKYAIGNRDSVSNEMTSEQIAEAQALARECVAKDYKDC
jgi:TPR repeat protein